MADEKPLTGTKASRRKQRKKKGAIQARRKKEFTYRGFTMEELLEMPFEEVLGLMPARVRRTFNRGAFSRHSRRLGLFNYLDRSDADLGDYQVGLV